MKIQSVIANNHRKAFEVRAGSRPFQFPYAKSTPRPTIADPVADVFVDKELGREALSYALKSGRTGVIHVDQILEYNQDPSYLCNILLYNLTIEAKKRVAKSGLAKREIIRRLDTSAAQLYRLLDQTNYRKSIDQMLRLLQVLDCEIDFVVKQRSTRKAA